MKNNNIAKCLALLTALKNNMPEGRHNEVESKYVQQYHESVNLLEKETGQDLSDFKISLSIVKPQITIASSHGNSYTSDSYCPRAYLLTKIDGLLGYFTLILSPDKEKSKIGFNIKNNN